MIMELRFKTKTLFKNKEITKLIRLRINQNRDKFFVNLIVQRFLTIIKSLNSSVLKENKTNHT